MNEAELEMKLMFLTTGSIGSVAESSESRNVEPHQQMLKEINHIFYHSRGLASHKIEYLLAIAYRNYTTWFIRGDARKPYFEKAVHHLQLAIDMGNNIDAKVELTRILIDEKQIRNIERALQLAEELKNSKHFPDWLESFVEKARRWAGIIDVPKNNNFSNINPTPASIREERIKLRKLLTIQLKDNNIETAKKVASRLYNLGLLASYLYKNFNGYSGVGGGDYDMAVKKFKSVKNKFKFEYLGRITDTEFLSSHDYKMIETVLNPSSTTTNTREIAAKLQIVLA